MELTPGSGRRVAAEINVTPLIDVLLVLLIIFMAIPPASVRGLDALVPQCIMRLTCHGLCENISRWRLGI